MLLADVMCVNCERKFCVYNTVFLTYLNLRGCFSTCRSLCHFEMRIGDVLPKVVLQPLHQAVVAANYKKSMPFHVLHCSQPDQNLKVMTSWIADKAHCPGKLYCLFAELQFRSLQVALPTVDFQSLTIYVRSLRSS